MTTEDAESKRKEVYTYEAPWETYAASWSCRPDKPFRLGVASFIQEYANKVEVIQLNEERNVLEKKCFFEHPYPATKILFSPDETGTDLMATTGDYLRVWDFSGDDTNAVTRKACLNNNKKTDFCAPLTSFDWNIQDPKMIATAAIDTTCSVWDINAEVATHQLIAHEKEVYDVAWARGVDIFASCGADGSVRLFDLRNLEHSTIIYEASNPLLRVAWNRQDPNYLGTIQVDGDSVILIDIRVPSVPVQQLSNHLAAINSIQWAPHSSCHILSGGDDSQALIWDLEELPKQIIDPILAYEAEAPINTLHWSSLQVDWVAICFGKKVQMLRV